MSQSMSTRAPTPPAVTRPVRTAGMGGSIRPPYIPRGGGRTLYSPVVPATPAQAEASDDLLADAAGWPELPDQGAAVSAWDTEDGESTGEAAAAGDAPADSDSFPLEAFFVPADAARVPSGYEAGQHDALADRVAHTLEDLAKLVRTRGVEALDAHASDDELARLVAAVVSGFANGD